MNFWSRLQQSFSVTSKVLRESIKILHNFMNGCDDIFALYFIWQTYTYESFFFHRQIFISPCKVYRVHGSYLLLFLFFFSFFLFFFNTNIGLAQWNQMIIKLTLLNDIKEIWKLPLDSKIGLITVVIFYYNIFCNLVLITLE